jgi:hypothetical protein
MKNVERKGRIIKKRKNVPAVESQIKYVYVNLQRWCSIYNCTICFLCFSMKLIHIIAF